jgi:hypothetical protein
VKNLSGLKTIVFGFLLVAFSSLAGADVEKCVDENGSVTYTNLPCGSAADAARGIASNGAVAIKEEIERPAKTFASNWEAREGTAAQHRAKGRKISLDVNTMMSARSSMARMDVASSYVPRDTPIPLDLRNARWFDFR